jgi:hypothetical protein
LSHIPANAAEVITVIQGNALDNAYIKLGIFGREEFDDIAPGIIDYIDGTDAFVGAGIRQKAWTTLYGIPLGDFCDSIKDVLVYSGLSNSM